MAVWRAETWVVFAPSASWHLGGVRRAPVELPYTEIAAPADLVPYVDRLWLRTTVCAAARAELGYFDQSHLSHELRDLIGLTPAAPAAERPIALSHLFGAPPPVP